MARNTDHIERDIEEARNRLAGTLDELSERANPSRLADDAKKVAIDTLKQPKVLYPLVGGAALVGLLIVVKIYRALFR